MSTVDDAVPADAGARPLAHELKGGAPNGSHPHRLAVLVLVIALTAGLLSFLFLRADAVSDRDHHEYERSLRELRQSDAELNAAVLASRVGLQADFDTIVATVSEVTRTSTHLARTPAFLSAEARATLLEQVAELQQVQQEKAHMVDHFKREISVLRNSMAYLPEAADRFIGAAGSTVMETRPVGLLVRGIMTYSHNASADLAEELAGRLNALEHLLPGLDEARQQDLRDVLRHGEVVLVRKPAVDALTQRILAQPTASLAEQVSLVYASGYEEAARRAHLYRVMLYVFALALAGYLASAMLRLGRTSHDLARANHDLEERIEALRRTRDELNLYATVFTNATEGMTITDAHSRIVAVNPAFTEITGFATHDVVGQRPSVLSSGRQDKSFYHDMWARLTADGKWQGEIWNRRASGELFPEWLSITAVRSEEGRPSHYIGIFSDITERKAAEARIEHLANHDALTNLPNRFLLLDRLDQAILQARRQQHRAAVLFINLDRFKPINDTLGHELGDDLLLQVARRCMQTVRETDTVARQGGDEFVVVLPDLASVQDATAIARKLVQVLEVPYRLGEHELTVTASIGVALYPDDGATASTLLRHADAAMYGAKTDGRNCFQFYSAELNTASLGELLLEHQLRGALDREELLVYYQPKVLSADGRLSGAEALLRWQHPELGLLAPGRFVPAAEESGLIVPIGEWVLRSVCRQLRRWMDEGLQPVPVAVNLSAQQFSHQDIVGLVRALLAEYRLPASLLEFELTETMLMRDVTRTIDILTQLRAMGVVLSIDDFGSGYSSLAYLKLFDVDVLKIDRAFVNDIQDARSEGTIAAAVIALAHSLGRQVVAEGVETEGQREFLVAHDCDMLQGYLFGRPEPVAGFSMRLRQCGGVVQPPM